MRILLILILFLSGCATKPIEAFDSSLHIKRSSMWVPDLDQAILFFRDIIGFEIDTIGTLKLEPDSVLYQLFNADPEQEFGRVLFSSSVENRILFVMASEDAPIYGPDDKRSAILVIRTNDLDGVIVRAKASGFKVGYTNSGTSSKTGRTSTETTIFGPGGNAVLVYQTTGPK